MDDVTKVWSRTLGDEAVILLRSVARARTLLLKAAGVQPGEPIALPANATRSLVEAVKHAGARPCFLGLDAALALQTQTEILAGVRFVWAQPVGGITTPAVSPGQITWIDYSDTLPYPGRLDRASLGATLLFGLHLSDEPNQAGALLFFTGPEGLSLYHAVTSLLTSADLPNLNDALAQHHRLAGTEGQIGLAQKQQIALTETWQGLQNAAGLPLLPLTIGRGLAHGVALYVPPESDEATFYAYIQAENTPICWLPAMRPIHYAASRDYRSPELQATATHLSRWLLVPVGADYTFEEISHTVLGVVKAAEYLGVRWYTQPGRAISYAALLDEWYGPGHDAYRPNFDIWEAASRQPFKANGPTIVCSISL